MNRIKENRINSKQLIKSILLANGTIFRSTAQNSPNGYFLKVYEGKNQDWVVFLNRKGYEIRRINMNYVLRINWI